MSAQAVFLLCLGLVLGVFLGMGLIARGKRKSLKSLWHFLFGLPGWPGADSNHLRKDQAYVSEEGRTDSEAPGDTLDLAAADKEGENEEKGPRHLMLSDENGEALIEIAPATAETTGDHLEGAELPAELTRILRALIAELPETGDTIFDLSTSQYRVFLKKPLRKGLRDGTFEMMKATGPGGGIRLNVVNGRTKKIVGQGKLLRSGKWRRYLSGSFQIVSFVAGQSHLAEISQRLDQIEETATEIQNHLKDERLGALKGKTKYMKELHQTLRDGLLSAEEATVYNNQLETIEREALETIETLLEELNRREEEIENLDPKEFHFLWRLHQNKEATIGEIERYATTARQIETALLVRLLAAELKTYLPVHHQLVSQRRKNVRNMIMKVREVHQATMETARQKARQLAGTVATEETTETSREEAEARVDEHFASIETRLEALDTIADQGEGVLQKRNQLLQKDVEIRLVQEADG